MGPYPSIGMSSYDAFVESDKFRRAVFTEIVAGESDPERITKKHRLIRPAVDRALDDLVDHGLIEQDGDGYVLTEDGERYEAERKKRELSS